jgi:phage terminase large subunit-like protein
LKLFKPWGWQEKFLKSRAKIRLALVGNQGGKTRTAAYETACLALGEHPYKEVVTPNVGIIVTAQTFKEGVVKNIIPALKAVCGSKDIKQIKYSGGIPYCIVWRNGSLTWLMSVEQPDSVFEGSTIHYAWFDEPVRREIYIATLRGLLKNRGILYMTCTPLSEPWIYEEIYLRSNYDKSIECFEGASIDSPYLSKEEIEDLKSRCTEDEIEARLYGRFKHLSGRVFPNYKIERHLIPSFDIPYHWPVWVGIDPHREKQQSAIFLAISPQDKKYVCNEIYHRCDIYQFAELIHSVGEQYNVVNYVIDTSAQEDGWNKVSARQMLESKGIRTKLAQKRNKRKSGIMLINQLFHDDNLFVMEHCKRVHREFTNQVYKKNRDNETIDPVPEKKWDDTTDPIRYVLSENPTYSGIPSIYERGPIYSRGE